MRNDNGLNENECIRSKNEWQKSVRIVEQVFVTTLTSCELGRQVLVRFNLQLCENIKQHSCILSVLITAVRKDYILSAYLFDFLAVR